MDISYPGESAEYRTARDKLLKREMELRRLIEDVAKERRQLPPGGAIPQDYTFQGEAADGSIQDVKLSELFAPGKDSLLIYNFMFPRDSRDDRPGASDGPCPSCVGLLDQLDGAVFHATQKVNFVVVAKAPLPKVLAFAKERGWRNLRMLSSGANSYNRDYLGEGPDGEQQPMLNVFHRDGDVIRHFWGSELFFAPRDPGQEPRHMGLFEPVWNLFDLTPQGRPDWDEQLKY